MDQLSLPVGWAYSMCKLIVIANQESCTTFCPSQERGAYKQEKENQVAKNSLGDSSQLVLL